MQSITNAAKGVFGGGNSEPQSGSEQVSGSTGAGTTEEPLDQGNQTGASDPTGAENTFGRDRGGPEPNNEGPHDISIANKLDPKVDSDHDGKPKSGPNDLESASGTGAPTTGVDGSNDTTGETTGSDTLGSTSANPLPSTTGQSGSTGEVDNSTSNIGGEDSSRGDTIDSSGPDNTTGTTGNTLGSDNTATRTTDQRDTPSGPGVGSTGSNVTGGDFSDNTASNANEPNVETRGAGTNKGPAGGVGAVEPSVGSDPSSGQKPFQKQQGADRPEEEPSEGETKAVTDEKAVTEGQQATGDSATGAGDDGDSKDFKKDPNDKSGEPLGSVPHGGQEEKKGEEGPQGASKSEGTGEQWVKTSGLAADGGDFDATKPGAGREADRLLEQKGVHRDPGPGAPPVDTNPGSQGSGEKVSKIDRIKEKLHLGGK
ncbi:hypothetical protein MMC09_006613 [Bachmanniomyces sp. S44760]|nr:hypothetical protein [Bachmanniomyces sp. S44760]